ncbi:MAG: hypothetical protein ACI9QL_002723 [Candidatus Omnitrophota bacterium]|jgi:hypothetical protein
MSSVKNFGAEGDGVTDDTEAIEHAIRETDGLVRFPRGLYKITRTINIPLAVDGPLGLDGTSGTATVRMTGSGPAFRLVGNHAGTGDPASLKPQVWQSERMPVIQHLVIEGAHAQADGIELMETMQVLFEGVLIRHVRHGIRLHKRNRNVLIAHSHIYHNSGVGIFLDQVNLHQINISSCHISYNRLGGIRIEGSEVRNLQITGNDIEYNNAQSHPDLPSEPTAEIWIDTRAEKASVNEVAICSNTIQATESVGGCNIRILENPDTSRPPGLIAITGNIIGSQENNVHLTGCYGVTLSGNCIYSCGKRNVWVEDSRLITLSGNSFRRHTDKYHTGIRFDRSTDCTMSGCTMHDATDTGQASGVSLVELQACARINLSGCLLLDGVPYGLDAVDCRQVLVSGCTIAETRSVPAAKGAVRFAGKGEGNVQSANILEGAVVLGPDAGVKHP